jgi:hypothetical protein
MKYWRGTDETTIVKVDGKQTYMITNLMLGSAEGFYVGSYEFGIGSRGEGGHAREFTFAEKGKGNGSYQGDAICPFGI